MGSPTHGILSACGTHYSLLAKDVTGNSRKLEKWAERVVKPQRRVFTYSNINLVWEERANALNRLKRQGVRGSDGVLAKM